jgi:hypothetical protein
MAAQRPGLSWSLLLNLPGGVIAQPPVTAVSTLSHSACRPDGDETKRYGQVLRRGVVANAIRVVSSDGRFGCKCGVFGFERVTGKRR